MSDVVAVMAASGHKTTIGVNTISLPDFVCVTLKGHILLIIFTEIGFGALN